MLEYDYGTVTVSDILKCPCHLTTTAIKGEKTFPLTVKGWSVGMMVFMPLAS